VDGPLRFAVRVKPGAKRAAVGGRWAGRHGDALVVAVTARAVEGKANEAVRAALAAEFGTRRTAVSIVAGERSRDKLVTIDPAPPTAATHLAELLAEP
jgi:uncharacterized protein